MSQPVIIETSDGVLTITLNRPEKRNALTAEMYGIICEGLNSAARDPGVRVVLLTGAGGAFTAGNDLKEFASADLRRQSAKKPPVWQLMDTMIDFEKPIVAAVQGPAVGIGTTLLLHCDLVIAGRGTTFALPFTRLGLVPEFASSILLPLLAGRVRASHTLLLGEAFGVDWARELGLVSDVCADSDLHTVAAGRAKALAALSPRALRATKRLINTAELKAQLRTAMERELTAFMDGLESPEHKEAVSAFFEKRPPDFSRFS